MQERKFWFSWSNFLHRWGLSEIAGTLLFSAGPIRLVLAQMVMIGQPLFKKNADLDEWSAVIRLLEDPKESESFVHFLNKEGLC